MAEDDSIRGIREPVPEPLGQSRQVGYWRLDVKTNQLHCTDSQLRIFGIETSAPAIEWDRAVRFVHADDLDAFQDIHGRALAGGQPYELEVRIKGGDGGERKIAISAQPEFNSDGDLVAFLGSTCTLKNRSGLDRSREWSEAQFRALASNFPGGLLYLGPDGRFRYVNKTYANWFGYEPEELVGRSPGDFLGPEVDRVVKLNFAPALKGETATYEAVRQTTQMGTIDVQITNIPDVAPDGTVAGVFALITDVTELKSRERTLHEMQSNLAAAQRIGRIGHWRVDTETGKTDWSTEMYRIWERAETEAPILVEDVIQSVHPEDRASVIAARETAIADNEPYGLEFRIITSEGGIRYLRNEGRPEFNEAGRLISIFGITQDVTERVHLEDQLRQAQKMEAVGQLTGGVAHEFNNLLAVIMGHAEVLEQTAAIDERAERNIQAILRSVNRGSSLTNRLLAFSRQQPMSPVTVDVTALITDLQDMVQRALGETIDLEVAADPASWPLTIDLNQFESAVLNLAINARDAMPQGGSLCIETKNRYIDEDMAKNMEDLPAGDYVEISVRDTGTGMPREVMARVFEPFFTTKEVGAGSGLGLSMVYGFAKQSKGHVLLESAVGEGAVFKIYLPRSYAEIGEAAPNATEISFQDGTERILVVEDDSSVREIPANLLRDQGYVVAEAGNGEEAVEQLRAGPKFDMLFTDVVLSGGMNGAEIAAEARRLQPGIKVLYTTGYAENVIVDEEGTGAEVALINKPYRLADLLERVRGILDDPAA